MATKESRIKQLERWPHFKIAYLRTFAKLLDILSEKEKESKGWYTPEDVLVWWLNEAHPRSQPNKNQLSFIDENTLI